MNILIRNIKELIQVEIISNNGHHKVCGKKMAILNTLKDAFLLIQGDKIEDFDSMSRIEQKKEAYSFACLFYQQC
ncbi:MAG: hypothetical protein V1904_05120 [Bacteroidota bacterium]